MLSGGKPRELLHAIAAGDARASRRCLASASAPPSGSSSSCARRSPARPSATRRGHARADDPRMLAREGLVGLGFSLQEADEMLASATGETPEDLIAEALQGGAGERRHPHARRRAHPDRRPPTAPRRSSTARCARAGSADFVGQERGEGPARGVHRGGAGARRGTRPRAARRTARPGQDLARPDRRRGAGRAVRPDGRPGARAQGRRRRVPDGARGGLVFFVDEIHRLPRALEETFYPAMEDRKLPITVGQGAGARVVTLDLPAFTLIGATTRAGCSPRRCATASA